MAISRVIEVSFGRSSVALVRIDTAYFYNNGILFKPTDIDLPASYQVHWSDSPQATSTLETIGTAEGAPIPDDLWGRSRVIYGWIYLHPTEDSGVTGYEVRIYKNVRAGLPDGTEPTPAEQSTIDQLISALNSAVEQTGEDVESASQSAQSAGSAKTAAESARDTAGEYANDAESSAASASTSASQASTSATASAQSASQSAQIKADVEGMVDDAQGYANSASHSASQASASEQGCARAVSDATSAAAIARARADEASGYAQTASTKASEAVGCVETATQKATEASQSATNASQSAQTAESAKTASQTAQGLAESARDSAVQAKTDAESARDEAQNLVDSISGKVDQIDSNTERIESLEDDRYKPYAVDSASGSIASFPDGADGLPLKSLVIDINPVQDLSQGDPSPENICPISGWTEVQTNQSGKNLFDSATVFASLGFTHEDDGSWSRENIAGIGNAQVWKNPGFVSQISIRFTAKYAIDTSTGIRFKFKYTDGTFGNLYLTPSLTYQNYTFTSNPDKVVSAVLIDYGSNNIKTWLKDVQFEASSFATPYSPYAGRSLTINLGQTVYGGKLDVLSGELVIDRAMVGLGTLNWTYRASNLSMESTLSNVKSGTNIPAICSAYKNNTTATGWASLVNGEFTIRNGTLRIRDEAYSDATAFKSAVTGQTLVYELAEPIEIQLTPNQINSLYGVNNLWTDSGDTEVEYRADTKLYINKKIAEAISALS